jgi:hypothetical protein
MRSASALASPNRRSENPVSAISEVSDIPLSITDISETAISTKIQDLGPVDRKRKTTDFTDFTFPVALGAARRSLTPRLAFSWNRVANLPVVFPAAENRYVNATIVLINMAKRSNKAHVGMTEGGQNAQPKGPNFHLRG